MSQESVPNVSYVFSYVYCKCVYLDVAYVSHICCMCFICMLRMFAMVSSVFLSISKACFKCFIYLQTYVVSIISGCFKSRSDVAHGMRMGSGRGTSGPMSRAPVWVRESRSGRGCAGTGAECRRAHGKRIAPGHGIVRRIGFRSDV
jgi:hypothetical protein